MKILIRSAKIFDPTSKHHSQVKDILISQGKITSIASRISEKGVGTVIEEKGLCVSPGWFDMHAWLADPGYEHKEDLSTGCAAAAQGGFTGIACMPDTDPVLDSKSEIEYVLKKTADNIVDVHPLGAISNELDGENITEMYDMHAAGAVAFSDGSKPVQDAALMMRSLLYVKPFGGVVYSVPCDTNISLDGTMNEGEVSTRLGLKGIPELAEELMIMRDLYLAEYTGGKVHFSCISTKRSVELIKAAKARGLPVTASVAAHHLLLDEEQLSDFDTNFKVDPPLRSKTVQKALIKGVADGTIDVVVSQHHPQEEEAKKVEFNDASFGAIGLESAYGAASTALNGKGDVLIERLAIAPRQILGLEVPTIETGNKANMTMFLPSKKWTFSTEHIRSRSSNTPFSGMEFKGKVFGVVNNDQVALAS